MDPRLKKHAKTVAVGTGKSLWFVLKIAVYLLVAYSVVFSFAVTAGAVWAKHKVDAFVESVEWLKDHNPERTMMMKQVAEAHARDTSFHLEQRFVPLDSISPPLVRAVLASEDAGFRLHPGIDIEALLSALQTNRERGKNRFGGSTITQQLAKNLFLDGEDKSVQRKAVEAVYALMMEKTLGKDRILELYLNYAQWGDRIFGVESAARAYYRTSAAKLGFEQSVALASVLANPERYNPHNAKSVFLSQRRAVIYNNLLLQRVIDSTTWSELRADSVPRNPVPEAEPAPAAEGEPSGEGAPGAAAEEGASAPRTDAPAEPASAAAEPAPEPAAKASVAAVAPEPAPAAE